MADVLRWALIAAIVCIAAFPWNVGPGNPLADSEHSIGNTAVGIVSINE